MNWLSTTCRPLLSSLILLSLLSGISTVARADRFVVINEKGEKKELIGRIHGSGQGALAIELPNGQLEIVAQGAVIERDSSVEWQPATPTEVATQLTEEFGEETFRSYTEGNAVIGLVLMGPLPKPSEVRAVAFMKKAAKFMNNVQNVFLKFTKDLRLPVHDPECPLVLLIFESDDDFNAYADEATQGQSLSANNISGFYNGLTNFLAIRMTECATFEVPLHEAIHQQVYNRGVLQRLAPIPSWFNEGIASGFESNGDRINNGPTKVHTRYAEQISSARQVTWDQLIAEDQPFRGDVLAGDAYCHAWALHWLLVTKHEKEYAAYVKTLSQKKPLVKEADSVRVQDFENHFPKSIAELQTEFSYALRAAIKTQRITPEKKQPGFLQAQKGLADFQLTATMRADQGGRLEVQGRMRNINPFRSLAFSIMVLTDGGTYAEWILPDVASTRVVPLPLKYVNQTVPGVPASPSQTFRVQVRTVLPDSEEAERWKRGETPPPNF